MALPVGLATVTVTGSYKHPDGTAATGRITFRPEPTVLTSASLGVLVLGTVEATLDASGAFSVVLLATDDSDVNPTGWTYRVTERLYNNTTGRDYAISLPSANPTVDIADLAPQSATPGDYLAVRTGTAGGDLSGTYPDPTVAKINGVTLGGTPASGKVLTATSAGAATWQTPSGGSGTSFTTARASISDGAVQDLASTSAWAIATSSVGTELQCSIAADENDRIRVCGNFLASGGHSLDWAILDSAGNIDTYASSGTGSPLTEGNPAMYSSASFSPVASPEMFTVAAGHIDGSGNITIALVHKGTDAGRVYCFNGYPWRVRLENHGPEPA